jgi:hypothetical protein
MRLYTLLNANKVQNNTLSRIPVLALVLPCDTQLQQM